MIYRALSQVSLLRTISVTSLWKNVFKCFLFFKLYCFFILFCLGCVKPWTVTPSLDLLSVTSWHLWAQVFKLRIVLRMKPCLLLKWRKVLRMLVHQAVVRLVWQLWLCIWIQFLTCARSTFNLIIILNILSADHFHKHGLCGWKVNIQATSWKSREVCFYVMSLWHSF